MKFLILIAVALAFLALVVVVGGVLFVGVLMLVWRGRGAAGSSKLRPLVEDWADEQGYELLEIGDRISGDHPFADRFGFGFGKKPALARPIKVRDRAGKVRRGWVYVRMKLGAGPRGTSTFGGFLPETLEVAWENGSRKD